MYSVSHRPLLSLNWSVSREEKLHCKIPVNIEREKLLSPRFFSPHFLRSPPPKHRALLFERLEEARFSDSSLCTEELKFRIPKSSIPDSTSKTFPDPGIQIPLHGVKNMTVLVNYFSINELSIAYLLILFSCQKILMARKRGASNT